MKLAKVIIVLVLVASAAARGIAQGTYDTTPPGEKAPFAKAIHLFPNPASEYVHISLDDLNAYHVKFTLHNIIGNEVSVESEVVNEHEVRLRVKDLASGYYLVALRDDQTKFKGTFKFLKR